MLNFLDIKSNKKKLLKAFKAIDYDNNGYISEDELKDFFDKD